jgi:hypothetical protein
VRGAPTAGVERDEGVADAPVEAKFCGVGVQHRSADATFVGAEEDVVGRCFNDLERAAVLRCDIATEGRAQSCGRAAIGCSVLRRLK